MLAIFSLINWNVVEPLIRERRSVDRPPFVVEAATPQRILINISIASDHGMGTDNRNIYQLQVSVPTIVEMINGREKDFSYLVEAPTAKILNSSLSSLNLEGDLTTIESLGSDEGLEGRHFD